MLAADFADFVSALLWRGKPNLLLELIRQRSGVPFVSSAADAHAPPSTGERLGLFGKTARLFRSDDAEAIGLMAPVNGPSIVPGEAHDDYAAAAAWQPAQR